VPVLIRRPGGVRPGGRPHKPDLRTIRRRDQRATVPGESDEDTCQRIGRARSAVFRTRWVREPRPWKPTSSRCVLASVPTRWFSTRDMIPVGHRPPLAVRPLILQDAELHILGQYPAARVEAAAAVVGEYRVEAGRADPVLPGRVGAGFQVRVNLNPVVSVGLPPMPGSGRIPVLLDPWCDEHAEPARPDAAVWRQGGRLQSPLLAGRPG